MKPRRPTLARAHTLMSRMLTYGRLQHDHYCGAVLGLESDCHCGLLELRAELKALDLPRREEADPMTPEEQRDEGQHP